MWNEKMIKYLKENYTNKSNKDLAYDLNISESSVRYRARRLGLKRSKKHRSNIIGKRNKMVGRDLSFNKLKEIAKNYKTRGEFQFSDPSAYSTARIKGYLNDICSHMVKQSYSIPQLILKKILETILKEKCKYDTRQIIKPYELDIYFTKYKLAFEYNGKGWHKNNKNDNKKIKLCNENGITLITIIENNRRYEEDIKYQLIENLDTINKITSMNIVEKDVNDVIISDDVFDNLLDDESIFNIVNEYNYYTNFRKENLNLYYKLLKLGKLDYYTKKLIKTRTDWDEDKLKKEIRKYTNLSDFINKSYGAYLYIQRNNLQHLLEKLHIKKVHKYTEDDIWNIVKKCNNWEELLEKISLGPIKRLKIRREITKHFKEKEN